MIFSVLVVWQEYEARVSDEFVLRGNAVLLKCALPSYVSDVVVIEAWISDQGETYAAGDDRWGKPISNGHRSPRRHFQHQFQNRTFFLFKIGKNWQISPEIPLLPFPSGPAKRGVDSSASLTGLIRLVMSANQRSARRHQRHSLFSNYFHQKISK